MKGMSNMKEIHKRKYNSPTIRVIAIKHQTFLLDTSRSMSVGEVSSTNTETEESDLGW